MTANDRVREFLTAPFDDSGETAVEPLGEAAPNSLGVSLLFFSLGRSLFALPANSIKAILESTRPVTVPFVRHRLCQGFIHLQGAPIPLLDLRALLRLPPNDGVSGGKTILLEFDGLLTAIETDGVAAVSTTQVREAGSLQLEHRTVVHRLTTFAGTPVTVLAPRDLSEAVQGGQQ